MTLAVEQLREYCRTLIPGYDPWKHSGEYVFDDAAAMRAVAFFYKCLSFTNAKWAGQPFILQPWQVAIIGNIFGWKRADGTRRYRKCLLFTARKSGKTELAAGIANYLLFCDGEPSPEIVSAAGNAEQAAKVFDAASKMVLAEPELSRRAEVMARAIRCTTNSGAYRVINAAAKTKHGGNLHAALIDELHVMESELVDVLETSMRARLQPLVLYTTTSGTDPETIAGEVYDYACKIRDGLVVDDEFLPVIFECPKDADISKPENWKLAQPNLGVTVPIEEYEKDYREALEKPRKMQVFRQLSLNQWTEASSAWIGIDDWKKCAGIVDITKLKGERAFGGLDLSSTTDTTSFVLAIPDGEKVRILPFIFLPEDNAEGRFRRMKRDRAPYTTWSKQGHLIFTPGNVVDYDIVEQKIIELADYFSITEIQADPYNASGLLERLQKNGLTLTRVRQGWSLAEACKETERLILTGALIHPDNPAYSWQFASATVHTDRAENIWPDKQKSTRRIDSVVATVMAINGWKFGLGREQATDDVGFMVV